LKVATQKNLDLMMDSQSESKREFYTPQKSTPRKVWKIKCNQKIRSSVQNKFLNYLKKKGVEIKEQFEETEESGQSFIPKGFMAYY
jgi:predicted nucleotide-binding protein (sugar kinase/HSP70/actin superfamily)